MDKYRATRETVEHVSKQVIGKSPGDARVIIESHGLSCRWIAKDGQGYMITADCKADRIGLIINNNVVTEVRNG